MLMEAAPKIRFTNTDEYIALFPPRQQAMMQQLRAIIKEAAPDATEVISYNMPAFKGNGILVYFAAYKNHIGFYPTAAPISVFADRLQGYKTSRGAIQLPISDEIPAELVREIVRFRVAADAKKAKGKNAK